MDNLLKAIYFATEKHREQKRRDGKTPYISHPLAVALILSKVTQDQNTIIAGVLHDVVEDTNATIDEIETLFGKKIAGIVFECTEENSADDWSDRKKAVLNKISKISKEAGLVKSADVLHNGYEIVEKVKEYGSTFLQNFHASEKDKLEYEHNRLNMLKKYHHNPLLKDIENNIKTLESIVKK